MSLITKIILSSSIALSLLATSIDAYGNRTPKQTNYDAIIVAGCKVKADGTPSLALMARTRHAADLARQGYAKTIVFTGGAANGLASEAAVAAQYLRKIEPLLELTVLLEERSTSTEENAAFSKALYPELSSILVVSDSYHIFRAEKVFDRHFHAADGSGRIPRWNVRIKGALRELIAIPVYFGKGNLSV